MLPAIVRMETIHGKPKELVVHDEILVPSNIANGFGDMLEFINQLKRKPGDVLLCSYPKCGTHWVGSLIRELTQTTDKHVYRPSMDIMELTSQETINGLVAPRLLTTHLRPRRLPRDLLDNHCKLVLVVRNPKDVFVSAYHQLKNTAMFSNKQSWEEFFLSVTEGKIPYGTYFDYLDDWESVINEAKSKKTTFNIEVFYYEDLKENISVNLHRLSEHLGLTKTEDELKRVALNCSINCLRENSRTENNNVPSTLKGCDGYSVLYRKGEVGDWKNVFTVAQNETFSKLIETRLNGSMFTFKYE